MKPCNRLDYPESETVYVLVADYPGLNKTYKATSKEWVSVKRAPPTNYTYEAYHVPDLKAYLELLRHLENDPHKCIINGRPKKSWVPGGIAQRKNINITNKKTNFLMFDIDEMNVDGWSPALTAAASYNMVQSALADINIAFAKENLECVIQMTASWGKPGNTGPRLRLIYQLDESVTTQAIYLFTKEFQKRYPYLHLDQAIYRPAQIVYTASPTIMPVTQRPKLPERGRVMKNKKSGTICWAHVSYGYDASYDDIVNTRGPHATPEQDRQFNMLCDKLAEAGLIREYDEVTEKAHIHCPWSDEHSGDTGASATSMWRNSTTGHAAIKCQHASHEDKTTKDFIKAWVDEGIVTPQDFQDVTYEDAKADFEDEPVLRGIDVTTLAPIVKKRISLLSMKELKIRFIHDAANDRYIDRLHGGSYKAAVLDKLAPRVKNRNVDPSSKAPYNKIDLQGVEAWHYTDETVGEEAGTHVDDIMWLPKDDMRDCIITEKHLRYYNSFNGLPTVGVSGDSELFIRHMRILFPDNEGFEWAMGFFAHMIQRPWEKPSNALLHVSPLKGLGRGRLFDMFNAILGNMAITVPLSKLVDNASDFNSFFDKKLLLGIEEVKVHSRKRDQANEILKTMITETRVTINKKYADEREGVRVFSRLFMMSNNLDAIKVDMDDRRMFVYEPPEGYEIAHPEHYRAFSKAMTRPSFLAAVMYELKHWKIQVYKPFEKPPITAAKRAMVSATAKPIETIARAAMKQLAPAGFCISKDRLLDLVHIQAHKQGAGHLLNGCETDLAQMLATWEFKIKRKKYLDEPPRTLYGRDSHAVQLHIKVKQGELGRKRIEDWDEKVKEDLLEYVV